MFLNILVATGSPGMVTGLLAAPRRSPLERNRTSRQPAGEPCQPASSQEREAAPVILTERSHCEQLEGIEELKRQTVSTEIHRKGQEWGSASCFCLGK